MTMITNTDILYLTSFNRKIFENSGRRLLSSFVKYEIKTPILVCYEDSDFDFPHITKTSFPPLVLLTYNLDTDEYLKSWEIQNRHLIPKEYGGQADRKTKPYVYSMWNYRMSKWFRKVVSLKYATTLTGYKYLVWIDSDAYLIKHLPDELIRKQLDVENVIMFYYLGKERRGRDYGIESGFLGFKSPFVIIEKMVEIYNGRFWKYKRWDDGYILKKAVEIIEKEKGQQYRMLDIAGKEHDVINNPNPFYNYVRHEKGKHAREKII